MHKKKSEDQLKTGTILTVSKVTSAPLHQAAAYANISKNFIQYLRHNPQKCLEGTTVQPKSIVATDKEQQAESSSQHHLFVQVEEA